MKQRNDRSKERWKNYVPGILIWTLSNFISGVVFQDRKLVQTYSMVKRRLMTGEVTYSWAKDQNTDLLISLKNYRRTAIYFTHLFKHASLLQQAAAHHLNISPEKCEIEHHTNWMHGSYNVCIPVIVNGHRKLLMRFPIPHRVGEEFRPGNADEKIRCEAGTYAWVKKNCPSISAPKLYGFALSTGQTFTNAQNLPLFPRLFHRIRCYIFKFLGYMPPTEYVRHQQGFSLNSINSGYLLIEYIDNSKGTMLSDTWEDKRHDKELRTNLFEGLAHILLDFARVPVPQIGSFIIDDNGYLMLKNRPLTQEIQLLESAHIPVDIPRDMTYNTVDSYITDTLTFHDSKMHHQPNAITDDLDGIMQVSALATMRATISRFFDYRFRRGPFIFSLNDIHASNILVDDNWNIQCLIDLEWACVRPIEMMHPPHWLTSEAVDTIDLEDFAPLYEEFMGILAKVEEQHYSDNLNPTSLFEVMKHGLENGKFWFSLALTSPTGLFAIIYQHIRPKVMEEKLNKAWFQKIMKQLWTQDIDSFIAKKLEDKAVYDKKLQRVFEVESSSAEPSNTPDRNP